MLRMVTTLTVDCGGGGLKAAVVDDTGTLCCEPVRVPTPYPLPPSRLVDTLLRIAEGLPAADRITVGLPGMIRHGVVVAIPHYVNEAGPHTPVDPELAALWRGFDARAELQRAFGGRPVLVLNDAEVHGAALVEGRGLELVLTLGTGLGSALFDDGRLAPHLELSHAPYSEDRTYDDFLSELERQRLGDRRWSRRVLRIVDGLRPVFLWDRLYLGGGNAARLVVAMPDDVRLVANQAGVLGGSRAWTLIGV